MFHKNLDLFAGPKLLLKDSDIKITFPNKYGLIGYNGSGKSTLLKHLEKNFKELDVYYVDQELTDNTHSSIKELLLSSNKERKNLKEQLDLLEKQIENVDKSCEQDGLNDEEFQCYQKMLEDFSKFDNDEIIVTKILFGLGFNKELQELPLSKFSGGWRMRVSIARGLYIKPKYLLLDEPTNHLDLEGILWLSNYLKKWKNALIIVSHDKYFLDEITDNIIHIDTDHLKLFYYNHGYTKFLLSREQKYNELLKQYTKQQKYIKELKKKNWSTDKIKELVGDIIKLPKRYKINIRFPDPGKVLSTNIITMESVTFGFPNKEVLFKNISLAIDGKSRIALVGRNGVGKSTLLKLLDGQIRLDENGSNNKGLIVKDTRNKIYYYDQFCAQVLNEYNNEANKDLTMVEYLQKINTNLQTEDIRKLLGTIGFESKQHNQRIGELSGGHKMKLQFIPINIKKPHLLLLDEPTNNLDSESIESLIEGINCFEGGVVIITHNVELIQKTECQVVLIKDNKLTFTSFDDYYALICQD